jgi:excisionase family DNA binding protein
MSKTATLIPPGDEAEAAQAGRALAALREGKPMVGEAAMPRAVATAMEQMLETLAAGGGAALLSMDAELTTQQAADILGVSRPTLVKFLEDGTMPFRTIGVHRRIKAAEVFAYGEDERRRQDSALDELVAINQRSRLYD